MNRETSPGIYRPMADGFMLTPSSDSRRAFTLLETLVALSLFTVASALLVQSALNAVRAVEAVRSDSDQEQLFRFVLRTIMAIEDREAMEDGDDWELPDESTATWEVEIEETEMLDLFRVNVEIELDRGRFGGSGEDITRNYQIFLYRPDWEYEDGNRDQILNDRRDNLEDRRAGF